MVKIKVYVFILEREREGEEKTINEKESVYQWGDSIMHTRFL